MKIKGVHLAVQEALNNIITKGGQSLYDQYLSQKLPKHTGQTNENYLYSTMRGAYPNVPLKTKLAKEVLPDGIKADRMAPSKVHRRPKSQQGYKPESSALINKTANKINVDRIQNQQQKQYQQVSTHKTIKPSFCIKYSCRKNVDMEYERQQGSLRKQKALANKKCELEIAQQQQITAQKNWRRTKLQNRIEQLTNLGIRYGFDDDGEILAPSSKQIQEIKRKSRIFKKTSNGCNNRQNKKILDIKYQTLDARNVGNRYPEQTQSIIGKKKGFVSSKFYKKLRITDREFNNQNFRQYTTIPFLNLSEGITITEQQRNVTASKSKQPNKNRNQFIKQSRACSFKSYLPESDEDKLALSIQTLSVDRPYTSARCDYDRPYTSGRCQQQTAQTPSLMHSSRRKSILWRPQSTNHSCRLSVNNAELVKQFVKQ